MYLDTIEENVLIANQRALFIDDSFISYNEGFVKKCGNAVKYSSNPILTPKYPWEGRCILLWGSVIWDDVDDLFKMWYMTYSPRQKIAANKSMLCYAFSHDGVTWERPELGLIEYQGSKNNNIVFRAERGIDSPNIILDPFNSEPATRFKMVLFDKGIRQFVRFASGDGFKWSRLGPIELPVEVGDRHSVMADTITGKWILYHKLHDAKRTICIAVSDDFEKWKWLGEKLTPSPYDAPDTEFYGMVGFNIGGVRMGFLEMFHILERRLDTQLVMLDEQGVPSRCMLGETFLERGSWGTWDHTWAFPANSAPIKFGEELRIYYQGRSTLHWAYPPYSNGHIGAIGMAKLRPDGFVYLETEENNACLITNPIRFDGKILCVNADASNGELKAELLDEAGNTIEGYDLENCHPLTCDATYFKLCWGNSLIEKLRSEKIRIRFQVDHAKLYSFWFSDGEY